MREVKPVVPQEDHQPTGRVCPKCGGDLVTSSIPCPDGRAGCLVAHHGMRCVGCGAYWTDS